MSLIQNEIFQDHLTKKGKTFCRKINLQLRKPAVVYIMNRKHFISLPDWTSSYTSSENKKKIGSRRP